MVKRARQILRKAAHFLRSRSGTRVREPETKSVQPNWLGAFAEAQATTSRARDGASLRATLSPTVALAGSSTAPAFGTETFEELFGNGGDFLHLFL